MSSILKLKIKEMAGQSASAKETKKMLKEQEGILESVIKIEQSLAEITYVSDSISEKEIIKMMEENGFEVESSIGTGGYS